MFSWQNIGTSLIFLYSYKQEYYEKREQTAGKQCQVENGEFF